MANNFGKINIELWDVSGDFKYEKCWAPIQQDALGIMFVYDNTNPDSEDDLKRFVEAFPKALRIKQSMCMCFINPHGGQTGGAIPQAMDKLDKHVGSCEETSGYFTKFETYLTRLLKALIERQQAEENQYGGNM